MADSSSMAALKMFGKASFKAAKVVAKQTAAATSKAVKELNKRPESIQCSNCPKTVKVPPELFQWTCQNEGCGGAKDKSNVFDISEDVCSICMTVKHGEEKERKFVVTCQVCKQDTTVPTTNAWKHFETAKKKTGEAADAAVAYSKKKYTEMRSVPQSVPCQACTTDIKVPTEIYSWVCGVPECSKKALRSQDPACSECKTKRPEMKKVSVKCGKCSQDTEVPFSVGALKADQAAEATKKFAAEANAAAKAQYAYLKAKPVEFNCSTCSTKLQAPPMWLCSCGTQNDRNNESCTSCDANNAKEKLKCAKCNAETPVPNSNFQNIFKKNTNFAQKMGKKVYYSASSMPYIQCDQCQSAVPIPLEKGEPSGEPNSSPSTAAEAPQPVYSKKFSCPKCAKVFEPTSVPK